MTYKRSKIVQTIYDDMDKFLFNFESLGKKPRNLYLTHKHYQKLLFDQNKILRDKNQPFVSELPPYKGYEIKVHNP